MTLTTKTKFFTLCFIVVALVSANPVLMAAVSPAFQPQTRVGFTVGDQWEPSIAADRYGHVYIIIPQYTTTVQPTIPGCSTCPSPTAFLIVSDDNGTTWSQPRIIAPPGSGQIDVQIKVDPVDGKTVYASWLQNNKSVIDVAKSTDFGRTWQTLVANQTQAGTDKDILLVHGQDVYVGYDHTQTVWVSSSHDGGQTFTSAKVNHNAKFGWSLTGGAAIDTSGNVYYAWEGYTQNGGAKGPVNIYVSKSSDGGATWIETLVDVSSAPPDCSAFSCGWAFLGPGTAMAADAAGKLYLLWNSGTVKFGPQRIYFSSSTDGVNWSTKTAVSRAPAGVEHAFPAVIAGAAGDVRIAWMDQRNNPHWNVYYRTSTDGGETWSAEMALSTYVPGFSYIFSDGFSFPFGDYFDLTIDYRDHTQACWGEGFNWLTPGSVWYTRQLR
jgi:BNR repeat protein/BNR/Asp-box repeat protein